MERSGSPEQAGGPAKSAGQRKRLYLIKDKVKRVRSSMVYRGLLALVAVLIVLLPLVYLALTALLLGLVVVGRRRQIQM